MPKITPLLTIPLIPTLGFAADVFSDDFNRATVGANYITTVTAGTDGGAALKSSTFLELTNDASAVANVSGRVSVATPFSGFSAPFTATLAATPGLVTWETNLRFNRASEPSGFATNLYGAAFILAGSAADFTTGNGYAVLYGSGVAPEPFRLVRYTGGLAGTVNDLITGPALGSVNNYAALRVTYDPATSGWSLFVRDDGASAWASPSTLSAANLAGTSTDATLTGTALTHAGYLWNHNTAATQTAQADNLRIAVDPVAIPEPATTATIAAAFCSLAALKRRRRRG